MARVFVLELIGADGNPVYKLPTTAPVTGQLPIAGIDGTLEWGDPLNSLSAKPRTRVATTENIFLQGLQLIDNVLINENDIVLAWKQDNPLENGLYYAKNDFWIRTPWADSTADVTPNMYTFVGEGQLYGNQFFVLSNDTSSIALGSEPLYFEMYPSNNFVPYTQLVGDGGNTQYAISHNRNLREQDIVVTLMFVATNIFVIPDFTYMDANNILLIFPTAPSVDSWQVTVKK